jgi:protein-tyrosine phosphatase
VDLLWTSSRPVSVYAASEPATKLDDAELVAKDLITNRIVLESSLSARRYFILREQGKKKVLRVAERALPLQRASNFRDVGGYTAANGKRVKWGLIFRSGAMPMLTEPDAKLIEKLNIKTIVDLRSLDEREIAPDTIDDRIGALFVSNDYSMKALLQNAKTDGGEYIYRGTGKALAPQYRAIFRRLLASDGAVLYHCSAGQDRTGVATALILSALGVDQKIIIADYHLSTELRRPQFEMPKLDPKDWPGNAIAPYYAALQSSVTPQKADPLYTKSGASHIVQFFELLDQEYGGVEGYLSKELGISQIEIQRLRLLYLE